MASLLLFGCGYLGRRVADIWLTNKQQVVAVTRFAERAAVWKQEGIEPRVGDVADAESLGALPLSDTVLFAVGFDRRAGATIESVFVTGLRNVLDRLPKKTQRIIYISSTGVYGQNDGQWVDENAICQPTRPGAKACLAAERLLFQHPLGRRAIVLRAAGLYGPRRIPRRREIENGEAIPVPAAGFLNLVHVDDAARVVRTVACADRQQLSKIYNVSDGAPVQRADYFRELARLLQSPPPTFATPDPSSHAAQRATTDKRVSNLRLREELGASFQFPDYRHGLADILSAERAAR